MIFVYNKLNGPQAQDAYNGVRGWFEQNPRRRVCNTDVGKIRKKHIKRDLLIHCKKNVTLKD